MHSLETAKADMLMNRDFSVFRDTYADAYRQDYSFAQAAVQTFGTRAFSDLAGAQTYEPHYKELVQFALRSDIIQHGDKAMSIAINVLDPDLRQTLNVKFGDQVAPSELSQRLDKVIRSEALSNKLAQQLKPKAVGQERGLKI